MLPFGRTVVWKPKLPLPGGPVMSICVAASAKEMPPASSIAAVTILVRRNKVVLITS